MPAAIPMDIPRLPEMHVVVDGKAEESAWNEAIEIQDLKTLRPEPGLPASQDTTIKIFSTEKGLYLHYVAKDSDPKKIYAAYGRRDSRRPDDYVGLLLDPSGLGERAVLFMVNPLGVQLDGTIVRGRDQDLVPWRGSWSSWDTTWESAGRRTPQGYEVEIEIPWTSIRHPAEVDTVGLLVFRRVARIGEQSVWPQLDANKHSIIAQTKAMGVPGEVPSNNGLNITPEMTYAKVDTGESSERINWNGLGPGLTVEYAPSSAFQIMGTLNPDFSQVESDQSKIDINQRYSLQYEEKRSFFLEGQEWFTHPLKNVIYTRTMVTPLYGLRTTAEADGWTVSALHVWDQTPSSSVSEGGGWGADDIGESTGLQTIGRIRKKIGTNSMVGAISSSRAIINTDMKHHMVGVDGRTSLGSSTTMQGAVLASTTDGGGMDGTPAPAAVLTTRTRTRHLQNEVDTYYFSPDFRSENGFVTRADLMGIRNEAEIVTYPNSSVFPRVLYSPGDVEAGWDTSGEVRELKYEPGLGFWLWNGSYIESRGEFVGEEYEDSWLQYKRAKMFGGTTWTRWLKSRMRFSTGTAPLYDSDNPQVGNSHQVFTRVILQPTAAITFSPEIRWERFLLGNVVEYEGYVTRFKVEVFATPTLWTRWIYDQSSFEESKALEALLAWEKSPGRAFYLGGRTSQGGIDDDGDPNPNLPASWQVFAKASWMFDG